MIQEVEISEFDLRYEEYRIKNIKEENKILSSILEEGIRDPLEGVDSPNGKILLNGFKRLRNAKKLGIDMVPYISLSQDEAIGILEFIRLSNTKSLNILEQAILIRDLRDIYKMSALEISEKLSKSKAWVSVRLGVINETSDIIRKKLFSGAFPTYSYMYTIRQFMRIHKVKKDMIEKFIMAVSGKKLSIREIEHLAYGYFKGPQIFQEQIENGNIVWSLSRLNNISHDSNTYNDIEKRVLRDFEFAQKYMLKIIQTHDDHRFKNKSFYAQANLLAGGILSKLTIFSKIVRDFYDRSGQA